MSFPPIVLIVIENGAAWPRWVDRCRADVDAFSESSRVLVQDDGETPASFAARVHDYVAEIASSKIAIVAIACSERHDPSAVEARRAIASHVARVMSKPGRLCFSEAKRTNGRARHALSSLVSELEQQWSELGLEVSVRFSTDRELASRVA